jgi:hypothetical protein
VESTFPLQSPLLSAAITSLSSVRLVTTTVPEMIWACAEYAISATNMSTALHMLHLQAGIAHFLYLISRLDSQSVLAADFE